MHFFGRQFAHSRLGTGLKQVSCWMTEPTSPVRTCTVRFVLRRNPLTRDFGLALMPRDGVHFVTVVEEESEAERAGIKVGDGVCEVNGRSPPLDSIAALLPPRGSDEYVALTVRRAILSAAKPATVEPVPETVAHTAADGAAKHGLAAAPAAAMAPASAPKDDAVRAQAEAIPAAPASAAVAGSLSGAPSPPPAPAAPAPAPAPAPPSRPPQPEAAQSTPDRVARTLSRAASETFNLGFLKDMLKCGAPRSRQAVSTVPGQQSGIRVPS